MAVYSTQAAGVTLTTAATKSLILLNPAVDGFVVIQVSVSLDNVTTDAEPVLFDLYRTVTLGTPAGTTGTQVKFNDTSAATAGTTSLTSLTTEPTSVEILDSWYITPHSGLLVIQYPLGREPKAAAAGSRIGLRYTTASGVTPKCNATILFDEQ